MPQGFEGHQAGQAGQSGPDQQLCRREAANAAIVLEPGNCLWNLSVGMVLVGDLLTD